MVGCGRLRSFPSFRNLLERQHGDVNGDGNPYSASLADMTRSGPAS